MTGATDANEGSDERITEHKDYEKVREHGCAGGIGALHSIQDLGCEINLRMPHGQQIVVTAPGKVDYWVEQITSASGDIFRMGMELNGERIESKNPNNMPTNYFEALNLLIKMVEHDPQNEVSPRPTHMSIKIPVNQ